MSKDCVSVLEFVSFIEILDVVSDSVQLFDNTSAARISLAIHEVSSESGAIVGTHDFRDAYCHGDCSGDTDFVDF
jgi:hypothetical protein